MTDDRSYRGDIESAAGYIRSFYSTEPLEEFIEDSSISPDDFRKASGTFDSAVAAVDGSNSVVLESGSFSILAIRAVSAGFREGKRLFTRSTPMRLPRLSGPDMPEEYRRLYNECFGNHPENPLEDEPSRAASVFRDTLEYWAAGETIKILDKGDCLMLDGNLRTSHASHDPVLSNIVRDCGNRGIYLVSVSKRNSLTWNGYPVDIMINALASKFGVKAPWYIEIPPEIVDQKIYDQWHRGRTYITKMHPASKIVLKIEVPKYADDSYTERAVSACVRYSGDGRIPGYPYPLMEAHRECCITRESTDAVRQDIIKEMDQKEST